MKYLVLYVIGDIEFLRLIFREFMLFLIGNRTREQTYNNIKWIEQGGYEFECIIEKNKNIPAEVCFSYISHAHKCIYEMED